MNTSIRWSITISLCFAISFTGCEKSSTGNDESKNNDPNVNSFTVSPATIATNCLTLLSISATDEDGEELTYSFTSDAGELSGAHPNTYWVAPSTAGTYTLTATVTDESGGESTGTVDVTVTAGTTQITGKVMCFGGTNENIDGGLLRLYQYPASGVTGFWIAGNSTATEEVSANGRKAAYTISNVPPGNYMLDYWLDVDNNAQWASAGDLCGVYGHLNLDVDFWSDINPNHFLPTQIVITDGETARADITNIKIAP